MFWRNWRDGLVGFLEARLNNQGFVAKTEDLNAVEAWLGSLPGEPYADVRRPMISTLNLCDLLPVSAVSAGPPRDTHSQRADHQWSSPLEKLNVIGFFGVDPDLAYPHR